MSRLQKMWETMLYREKRSNPTWCSKAKQVAIHKIQSLLYSCFRLHARDYLRIKLSSHQSWGTRCYEKKECYSKWGTASPKLRNKMLWEERMLFQMRHGILLHFCSTISMALLSCFIWKGQSSQVSIHARVALDAVADILQTTFEAVNNVGYRLQDMLGWCFAESSSQCSSSDGRKAKGDRQETTEDCHWRCCCIVG